MPSVVLSAHGYRLAVNPRSGGSITGLAWRHPAGAETGILRACRDDQLVPGGSSPLGCFPMAPFANRIDGGVFRHDGTSYELPVDRPEEQVAIHGLSRFAPFSVELRTESRLRLVHHHRGDVFAYDLSQEFVLGPNGLDLSLRATNSGAAMPFGIGLHPYFLREAGARLRFEAEMRSISDARHLPVGFVPAHADPDFGCARLLAGLDGFDAHYSGWSGHALLERPGAGVAVSVTGRGALRNMHLYLPPGGDLVCIEPVSHVPDVHNRRTLARFGDLAVLEPGAALEGSMRLSVVPLVPGRTS